jgi:hypothetical protein
MQIDHIPSEMDLKGTVSSLKKENRFEAFAVFKKISILQFCLQLTCKHKQHSVDIWNNVLSNIPVLDNW